MARKPDPSLFPSEPPKRWMAIFPIPEFVRLMAVMTNFVALVMGESAESIRAAPKNISEFEKKLWVKTWLSGGLNEDAEAIKRLDTAAISAATIIREKYQPPVLKETIDSLKPLAVELMGRIDAWLSLGIAIALEDHKSAVVPEAEHNWHLECGSIIKQLNRIYCACGGNMVAGLDPSSASNKTISQLRQDAIFSMLDKLASGEGLFAKEIATKLPENLRVAAGTLRRYDLKTMRDAKRIKNTRGIGYHVNRNAK